MCNVQTLHTILSLDDVYLLVLTIFTFILFTDIIYYLGILFLSMKRIAIWARRTNEKLL